MTDRLAPTDPAALIDRESPPGPELPLVRFDRVERGLHWVTAGLFGVLMFTALGLYLPSVAALVGRRRLLAEVHLWVGLALPWPLLLSVAGPWGRGLRQDIGRINRWRPGEFGWFRSGARPGTPPLGKFNPGQKLNATFVAGAIFVLLGTGSVMHWFVPFPDSWRTGATFVHDVVAALVFVTVIGHVLFALAHPEAMASMVRGRVSRRWAARHAPAWLAELYPDGSPSASPPNQPERSGPDVDAPGELGRIPVE